YLKRETRMEIKFFDTSIEKYIQSLEPAATAKVLRTIDMLEMFGHRLGMPHSKKVVNALFELRTVGQSNIRLFYTFHKNRAVILHGYTKKSNKIPKKELAICLQKLRSMI
ncbi:MAG: type II toxin-antitoxin system RelE/ParE family toxin, partial [bacterium]|nr:type II toxin-antitoxin system RelE/ParE family toxin [bacterium]